VTEHRTAGKTDTVAEAVAAAIGQLGQATAAAIAAEAGVPYSTTNKKLRILKETGRAETFDGPDNHTLWRLTNAVGAAVTRTGQPDPDGSQAAAAAPPAEQAAAGPDVTVVPAEVLGQLADEPNWSAAHGGGPTGVTADAATMVDAGDQLVEALDGQAGQPVVMPADRVEADPDDDSATAVLNDGPAGPPDGAANVDEAGDNTGDATGDDDSDQPVKPAPRAAKRASASAPRPAAADGAATPPRRAGGTLRGAILDILEANPDRQYKVGELCKLIDAANADTGAAKASQGAVANAGHPVPQGHPHPHRGPAGHLPAHPAAHRLTGPLQASPRAGVEVRRLTPAPVLLQRQGATRVSPTLTAVASVLLGAAAGVLAGAAITAAVVGVPLARSRRDLHTARHALTHDPLTGLPNRRAFLDHLDTALHEAAPHGGKAVAVAMLDLDRFKAVNDRLGHRAGDEMLCQVADRLRALPAPVRLAARLQGDEFLLLIDGANPSAAAHAAWRAIAATPYIVAGGHRVVLRASIGVAVTHSDAGPDADHGQLLHDADLAMYRAKATSTGVVIADRRAQQPVQDRPERRGRDLRPPPGSAPPTGHP
jgi:diguanylate cyclase (GGDEF)-like protein